MNSNYKEYKQNWDREHREHNRNYRRKYTISQKGTDGKTFVIRVGKRDYPLEAKCELCNNNGSRLVYHHWDNKNPEVGAWICLRCHQFVHASENGLTIYDLVDLKHKIESEITKIS